MIAPRSASRKPTTALVATASALVLTSADYQIAHAATIVVEITATVQSVSDTGNILGGAVLPGDTIRGFYTYETTTRDTISEPTIGEYRHTEAPHGMDLEVNGLTFQTDREKANFVVLVVDDFNGTDAFQLLSYSNLFEASASGSSVENTISWGLSDPTMRALSSAALPSTAPVLSEWQPNPGLDIRSKGSQEFLIRSNVISAVVVPEPSTISLIVLAAGMFAAQGRRKR